jgi:hypothetical protein
MSPVIQVYRPAIDLLPASADISARVITQSEESTGVPVRHQRPRSASGTHNISRLSRRCIWLSPFVGTRFAVPRCTSVYLCTGAGAPSGGWRYLNNNDNGSSLSA